MAKFSLNDPLLFIGQEYSSGIMHDGSVDRILDIEVDGGADHFSVMTEGTEWVLVGTGFGEGDVGIEQGARLYIEYVDVHGRRLNALETMTVYPVGDETSMPRIRYVENIATRIGERADIVLHCDNLDLVPNVEVFVGEGDGCRKVDAVISGDTVSFSLDQGVIDLDECGVYPVAIGFGECSRKVTYSEKAIIRYRFDSSDIPGGTSVLGGEGSCIFPSDMSLYAPTDADAGNVGAGTMAGGMIYVKSGMQDCDCSEIRKYDVRLKHVGILARRAGEQLLDGVQLREGDIVWLDGQNDGTDGLWQVSQGDWYGLGSTFDPEHEFNPCTDDEVALPVDCHVLVDFGARVTDKVDFVCAQDVPVKHGSQRVCGHVAKPGDVLLLTGQADDRDGIWQVTCSDWVYLGPAGDAVGNVVDMSSAIIVQDDIDFCKCGGIFHIDYYYLNASCYLNHVRRTVKVLCGGASIAPNVDRQFAISDYRIRTGVESSLVDVGGTPGDPVREDCLDGVPAVVDGGMTVKEYRRCGDSYGIGPNCRPVCDCERFYTVISGDRPYIEDGFSIVFWQRGAGGWHLFAYNGEGSLNSGMSYDVYHLHVNGRAEVDDVDVNAEVSYYERGADGIRREIVTRDAWFVEHGGVLADNFGLVDDRWEFVTSYGYTHVLSADTLYQKWRPGCTTVFLAHKAYYDGQVMRLTCEEMADLESVNSETVMADEDRVPLEGEDGALIVDELSVEDLFGMEHVYGFRYYPRKMGIAEFVRLYNSFEPSCVHSGNLVKVLGTDDSEVILSDENAAFRP